MTTTVKSDFKIHDYAGVPTLLASSSLDLHPNYFPFIVPRKIEQDKKDRTAGVYEIIDNQIVVSCPVCKMLIFIDTNVPYNNYIYNMSCHVCSGCDAHHYLYLEGYNAAWQDVKISYPKKRELPYKHPHLDIVPITKETGLGFFYINGALSYCYVQQSLLFVKRSTEELIELGQLIDKKIVNNDDRLVLIYGSDQDNIYVTQTCRFYVAPLVAKYFDKYRILNYLNGEGSLKDLEI